MYPFTGLIERAADELRFGQPPAVADVSSQFSSPD